MGLAETSKTLVQCDFDGTITEEDISFLLLDAYAEGDWRQLDRLYDAAQITVGRFNADAFAMVKADRESLLRVARQGCRIRDGFHRMVDYCRQRGFRLVIVSNGLDFYIDAILHDIGLADIEFFAAQTSFRPEGLRVQYLGPDGKPLDDNFKGSYVNLFLNQGYRVIYAGNGVSDFAPASLCHHIFATGSLLKRCRQEYVDHTPFTDFNQVIRQLEHF